MPEDQPTWQKTVQELTGQQTIEQAMAGMAIMGAGLGKLWTTLVEQGVREDDATQIVCCYLSEVLNAGRQS